jgi:hypothetical protein
MAWSVHSCAYVNTVCFEKSSGTSLSMGTSKPNLESYLEKLESNISGRTQGIDEFVILFNNRSTGSNGDACVEGLKTRRPLRSATLHRFFVIGLNDSVFKRPFLFLCDIFLFNQIHHFHFPCCCSEILSGSSGAGTLAEAVFRHNRIRHQFSIFMGTWNASETTPSLRSSETLNETHMVQI